MQNNTPFSQNSESSAPLGNTGEIHPRSNEAENAKATAEKSAKLDAIFMRYLLQNTAKELLKSPSKPHAIQGCHRWIVPNRRGVDLRYSHARNHAAFSGLRSCGFLYPCAVCAYAIVTGRAAEITEAIVRWKAAKGRVTLNTYTVRHNRRQSAREVYGLIMGVMGKFKGHRQYKKMMRDYGIVGTIRVVEITFTANGWHVHIHEVAFHRKLSESERGKWLGEARALWAGRCFRAGTQVIADIAYDSVEGFSSVADYVAKFGRMPIERRWSLEDEVTKSPIKRTRAGDKAKKGRTPFDLLADAAAGDSEAARLFIEYVGATKGKRQLRWSDGLEEILGMSAVKTDVELSREESDDYVILGWIEPDGWKALMKFSHDQRAELLGVMLKNDSKLLRRWLLARNIKMREHEADNATEI